METRFVERDAGGEIVGIFGTRQPGRAEEEIAEDAPEFLAFLAAAHRPAPPSPREWLNRLPAEKQAAVAAAARASDGLFLWFMKAAGAAYIDVAAQETIAGINALVSAGVLDAADQAVLLAP